MKLKQKILQISYLKNGTITESLGCLQHHTKAGKLAGLPQTRGWKMNELKKLKRVVETLKEMEPLFKNLGKSINDEDFTVDVFGVELCVAGDYSPADRSVNWPGGFQINKVWVALDLNATDILHLLSGKSKDYIEEYGFDNFKSRGE